MSQDPRWQMSGYDEEGLLLVAGELRAANMRDALTSFASMPGTVIANVTKIEVKKLEEGSHPPLRIVSES